MTLRLMDVEPHVSVQTTSASWRASAQVMPMRHAGRR
jgi:hypothetical protein